MDLKLQTVGLNEVSHV